MKKLSGWVLIALLLTVTGVATAKDFDPQQFDDQAGIEAGAKKMLQKSGLKKIQKADVKTIAITEFAVEYITKKKQMTQSGNRMKSGKFGLMDVAIKGAEAAGVGEKTIDIDPTQKEGMPNELYQALVAELEAAGFEVISAESLRSNETYQNFNRKKEGKKKSKTKGKRWGNRSQTKTETFSAEGLSKLDGGPISAIKNVKAEARLMNDLGADMAMRVRVRLGVYDKGKPSIEPETIISVASGVTEQKMLGGKMSYNAKNFGTISVKKPLTYQTNVVEGNNFEIGKGKVVKVNPEQFSSAMGEMFPAFARMFIHTLQ